MREERIVCDFLTEDCHKFNVVGTNLEQLKDAKCFVNASTGVPMAVRALVISSDMVSLMVCQRAICPTLVMVLPSLFCAQIQCHLSSYHFGESNITNVMLTIELRSESFISAPMAFRVFSSKCRHCPSTQSRLTSSFPPECPLRNDVCLLEDDCLPIGEGHPEDPCVTCSDGGQWLVQEKSTDAAISLALRN